MDNGFVYNWAFENFTYCLLPMGEAVCSPVFVADTPYRTHWRLRLYPGGLTDSRFVSCFLECHSHNEPRERLVYLSMSVLESDAEAIPSVVRTLDNVRFSSSSSTLGFPQLVAWDTLSSDRRRYLPQGSLVIRCHLIARPPSYPNDEALSKLSHTFKMMYLSRDFTDLMLLSGKESFPVHRDILCARAKTCSQKFSLLRSKYNTAPKHRSKISVGHIPSTVLKAFLLYLYCGVLETIDAAVWNGLYDLAERYQLFDLQRDIFPTPTISSSRTRVEAMSKSIVFSIENFCSTRVSSLGHLIDLGFARVGVEYFNNDDVPGDESVGLMIWCFVDSLDKIEKLLCTVSMLDVDGVKHFTFVQDIVCDDFVTTCLLPSTIARESLLNDTFLSCETLRMSFKFTVISGLEPVAIETIKTCRALCLGREPPSHLTLSRLSQDMEQLVEGDAIATSNPNQGTDLLHKAIMSAWSPVYAQLFHDSQQEQIPLCPPNIGSDIGKLVYSYMCTGRIDIPSFKIASDLYSAALTYRIESLKRICLRNMTSKLALNNIVEALVFAHTYDEEEFYTSSQNFISDHKDEIFDTEEWKNLSRTFPYLVKKVVIHLSNNNSEAQT